MSKDYYRLPHDVVTFEYKLRHFDCFLVVFTKQ